MSQFQKNLALWLVISLLMIMLFNMMTQKETEQKQINYTEFLTAVEDGRITNITFQGNQVTACTTTAANSRPMLQWMKI